MSVFFQKSLKIKEGAEVETVGDMMVMELT